MSIGNVTNTVRLVLAGNPSVYYDIVPTIADINYPSMSYKIIEYGDNVQNVIEDMMAKGYTETNSEWLLQGQSLAKYKFQRYAGTTYDEWLNGGQKKYYSVLCPFYYRIQEWNGDAWTYYQNLNSIAPEGVVLNFQMPTNETSFRGCGVYLLACLDKYERPVYMFKGVPCSVKSNRMLERIPPSSMTSYFSDHRNSSYYSGGFFYPYYSTSNVSDGFVFMNYKGTYNAEQSYPSRPCT